jgi:hypothetical protein
MPITGISSWRPTMEEFIQHWERVNLHLAPNELRLTGGFGLDDFLAEATALNAAIDAVFPLANAALLLAAQRDTLKGLLRERARQYRLTAQGLLADSIFAHEAPSAPIITDGFATFLAPLNKIKQDWAKINALTPQTQADYGVVGFVPPLLLAGGYTLAQFEADVTELTTLWPTVEAKVRDASFARDRRDALMAPMKERLKQYRQMVPALIVNDPALIASLPRLSPPPGNTPDGAHAEGHWDGALNKAKFTWPAATDAKIDHFSVRLTPGPRYSNEDEATIADLPRTATSFETDAGLSVPGAIANFKIYTVAAAGNENGGHAIEIIRPVT